MTCDGRENAEFATLGSRSVTVRCSEAEAGGRRLDVPTNFLFTILCVSATLVCFSLGLSVIAW